MINKSRVSIIFLLFLSLISFVTNASTLKITTFNTGLAHTFVPLAQKRKTPIMEALSKSKSDVICLQEVWNDEDRLDIKKHLIKKFPYIFYKEAKQDYSKKSPSCHISDLFGDGKFISCIRSKCDGKKGDDFTKCLIQKCGGTLTNLKNSNRQCAQSLLAQVGKSTFVGLFNVLNPFSSAGVFAFKGSDGLMLLSKKPFLSTTYSEFNPKGTTNRRSVLFASIKSKTGPIQIGCSHLTANLEKIVPYTGPYKNWKEENYSQIKKVIGKMKLSKQIILGDFNCAFTDKKNKLGGDFEKGCSLFKASGYTNHFQEKVAKCTYCKSNLILISKHRAQTHLNGALIDHVFTKGLKILSSKRIFDKEIIVLNDKEKIKTHLSDHYGIEVTMEL